MNIQDFIFPELLILIPTCWGVGLALKSILKKNHVIPPILCCASVFLAILWVWASMRENPAMLVFMGVTQGALCWLVAWLSFEQGIKRLGKKKGRSTWEYK